MPNTTLSSLMAKKILILDGAMGTMIQSHQLSEEDFRGSQFIDHPSSLKGNNDLLSLTKPDLIRAIHLEYFMAGADLVETNTFSSTSIAQADYGLESSAYDLNVASAKLANEAAQIASEKLNGKSLFVVGSVGPTNKTASISPDVNNPGYRATSFDELASSYNEQINGLIDGGVDILMIETVFDTLNAKAAMFAVQNCLQEKKTNIPLMISGTITDASGRTLSGQTTEAFLISVSHLPLLSVGFNCALGARQLLPYLQILDRDSTFGLSAHPNAGLPNAFGEYDQSPKEMADEIEDYLKLGLVNIIGGCCGTGPAHIQAIAQRAANYAPRKSPLPQD